MRAYASSVFRCIGGPPKTDSILQTSTVVRTGVVSYVMGGLFIFYADSCCWPTPRTQVLSFFLRFRGLVWSCVVCAHKEAMAWPGPPAWTISSCLAFWALTLTDSFRKAIDPSPLFGFRDAKSCSGILPNLCGGGWSVRPTSTEAGFYFFRWPSRKKEAGWFHLLEGCTLLIES